MPCDAQWTPWGVTHNNNKCFQKEAETTESQFNIWNSIMTLKYNEFYLRSSNNCFKCNFDLWPYWKIVMIKGKMGWLSFFWLINKSLLLTTRKYLNDIFDNLLNYIVIVVGTKTFLADQFTLSQPGGTLSPPSTTRPPGFSDLAMALKCT